MANIRISERHYTDHWARYCTDYVDEYVIIADVDYNLEQFENLLKGLGYLLAGVIKYAKRRLTYANGKIEYKYICECRMYE